ncbi:unnamed protein product [Linum trigynum]|uniref:Uncharacterized protein n=1 Tax=Linum trigynum TaxID=586398 RepID=A0AAV2ESL0_9ROSI
MSCPVIKPVVADTFFSVPSSPSSITRARRRKCAKRRGKPRPEPLCFRVLTHHILGLKKVPRVQLFADSTLEKVRDAAYHRLIPPIKLTMKEALNIVSLVGHYLTGALP